MFEKYLELLEHNLNWVKDQLRKDRRMTDTRFARAVCNSHKYRVVGALELMLDMKEITWEKEHEERKKMDELFKLENLLKEIEKEGKK